jgi:hypothetical protein
MATVPAIGEIGEVEPPEEATVLLAQRTVAQHALNKADLEMLLDMLGLREKSEPTCNRCGGPMTAPDGLGKQHAGSDGVCWRCLAEDAEKQTPPEPTMCGCGKPAVRGRTQCRNCRELVPARDFRAVFARIQHATGRTARGVSVGAGLNPDSVASIVTPRSTRQRVSRGLYDQLVAAYQDEVDLA